MPSRDPSVTAAYKEYQANAPSKCPFCYLGDREITQEFEHFNILCALFPYTEWDSRPVVEHLMAVPKQHRELFDEFNDEEAKEILHIMTIYEKQGYSVYARAPKDTTRSVAHQHTHLILLER